MPSKDPVDILVVEDSPTQAEYLVHILKDENYSVSTAKNGKEGLERIRAKLPTLVISDVMMPEMDGYEMCSRIRTDPALNEVPVILLTSMSDPLDVIKGLECGADNFITKPYEKDYLLARIRYVLANQELRKHETASIGVEIVFSGKRYVITSQRQQILDLLLSIYEAAIQKNRELKKCEQELRDLNVRLEQMVRERTEALAHEIEERVQVQKERNLFFALSQDMLAIVGLDGCIKEANVAFERDLGYSREEMKKIKYIDLVYPADRRRAKAAVMRLLSGDSISDFELRSLCKDGSTMWTSWSISTSQDKLAVYATGRNVSSRKKAEQEIQATNRRLEDALSELRAAQDKVIQQERLHAYGQMASGIAHDFNNALSPILGYTELLLHNPENLADPERAKQYVETISVAAKDAANVVRQMREFFRKRDKDEVFAPVDLNELIRQSVKLTQPRWKSQRAAMGASIKVETSLPEVPPVDGNESELREAIVNLIFNAVDAMPVGGTITIKTEQVAGRVLVSVSDTGTGMTEDVRQRCLEPFFSTKGKDGTGLGLSMVFGIIKRHEGTLDIQTRLGKGTTFLISFPAHAGREVVVTKKAASAFDHPLHILLVEDEPLVRDVMEEYLAQDGHTVTVAVDGLDGFTRFRSGAYDLVVTDMAMPEMNGDQLSQAIKEVSPGTPIVLLSGFGDLMRGADDHPACVDCIVSKPATLDAIRDAIAKVMS